jgi:hypothetical protein
MSRTPAKVTQADRTFIYFLRAGEFVKIGRSKRWKVRMAHMQIGSPYTIVPLLVVVGDAALERRLHSRFKTDHFRGEWFHMSPTINAFIKENLKDSIVDKTDMVDLREPEQEIVL